MRFTELEKPQYQFMTEIEKERLAFQKAQQLYQESFQEASLTGMWKGQTTVAEQQRQYQNALSEGALTGTYNGQQTAAERNAAFSRAVAEAGLTGKWGGQETTDWQAQQAGITGRFGGQATMAREAMEGGQGLDLLRLQASLRGPRNALAFARSVDATGQGLRGALSAFAGRQPMQAFGGVTGPLERATVAGLTQDVLANNGQGYGPVPYAAPVVAPPAVAVAPPAVAVAPPAVAAAAVPVAFGATVPESVRAVPVPYAPGGAGVDANTLVQREAMATQNAAAPVSFDYAGQQAASNLYNYQPTGDGSYFSYPPGMTAPPEANQISSSTPLSQSELDKYSEGLANPNQIDTRAWNNSLDYTKEMMMGAYEDAGWDADYVEQLRRSAMPKYAAPKVGAFI